MSTQATPTPTAGTGMASKLFGKIILKMALWTPPVAARLLLWSIGKLVDKMEPVLPKTAVMEQITTQVASAKEDLDAGRSSIGMRWQQLWLVYGRRWLPGWLFARVSQFLGGQLDSEASEPSSSSSTAHPRNAEAAESIEALAQQDLVAGFATTLDNPTSVNMGTVKMVVAEKPDVFAIAEQPALLPGELSTDEESLCLTYSTSAFDSDDMRAETAPSSISSSPANAASSHTKSTGRNKQKKQQPKSKGKKTKKAGRHAG